MTSYQFQESIRHIYCMNIRDFKQCFGDHKGDYLWDKFKGHYAGNVGDFICYLDCINLQALVDHCLEHCKQYER